MFKKMFIVLVTIGLAITLNACGEKTEISNLQKLLDIKNAVTFTETDIIDNIDLNVIDEDVTASWESNKPEIISNEGVVTRPSFAQGDTTVFLTLTITLGEDEVTKIFEFNVLALGDAIEVVTLNDIMNSISFANTELTEDLVIPEINVDGVTVTWTTTSNVLGVDGVITRPSYKEDDIEVGLKLELSYGEYDLSKTFAFTIIKEVKPDFIELDTDYTDALLLDFSYENSNFISDGYGEVTLVRCVDGDTAVFSEGSGSFTVRFLGINTPESTYKFEPWGKAASTFTCDKLTNASSIVLEYDADGESRTDGNGRYLGWVWYDGRLLNLELVEEAYTGSKGVGGTKYETTFYYAEFKTQDSDRRIWGEVDPDFDYSLDGVQITIEELVTNQELYVGMKVVIRGTIARTIGGHPYIVDNGFGIYLFKGYDYTTKLAEGNEVIISALTLTYYPDAETGSAQLTGFSRTNIEVLSEGNVVEPTILTIPELSDDNIGSLVKVMNLTVLSIYENSYDDAFTVTAEDEFGNVVSIRRDSSAISELTADLFSVGLTFDIVAPLGRYDSQYQLMLSKLEDIIIN
mgnify:FL=1